MTETLILLLVLLFSPLCVMLIGGDNVTSSSSVTSSPSLMSPSISASSVSSLSSSSSSSASSSSASSSSPLALALATVGEPALLAHVYDTHANFRHRHHPNHPWGPHFEENVVNVTVREYQNIHLDCRVGLIEDKLVSWVRRKSDQLELLTLGTKNHSSDPRFLSDFKYPNNWRLAIRNISRNDSGIYLCQISTHPPKVLEVQLTVEAPEVFVISSRGERVQDVHYKEGSTLQLICEVNNLKSRSINWYHNSDLLNHDITRGGVSIKTEIIADHAKSILNLARITRKDIGTYLCSAPPQNATVTVHILNGENPAELYHNQGSAMLLSHLPHHHFSLTAILLIFISSPFVSLPRMWMKVGALLIFLLAQHTLRH
ncbi:unnamed protein product [Orchesella dallaii]|uniref:Ig-like domain-containing protein n=1 Tax=Orchesella dallaii TaxID=48710 RepID=A0ABP1Q7P4_9HEXA